MATILIVGCGAIGTALAQALTKQGHRVMAIKRHPPVVQDPLIHYYAADIRIKNDLEKIKVNFEHIFFILSADGRTEQAYQDVYETGLDNLLDQFNRGSHPPIWWMVSSTSVYGQCAGEWVDETSEACSKVSTAQFICKAEQKLMKLNQYNVVVRFSGIYGPGRDYLLRLVRQIPAIQKDPPYYTNRIHAQDCVSVLEFLFNKRLSGTSLEQCYLATDDDPAPQWEVMTWLAEQMHEPLPIPKIVKEGQADANKRCSNQRLKQLGYAFRYSNYRQGYAELL